MKRTNYWIFIAVLTFALGVAAVFGWFNYQRSPAQTVQSNSLVESKTEIESEKRKADVSQLARNRQLWNEQNIVNYSFVSEQFADGMYPFVPMQIKVEDGKAISMKLTRKNAGLQRTDGYDKFNAVKKMFDEIQAAIDRGDSLNVTYNKERGFPEEIFMERLAAPTYTFFSMKNTEFEIIKTN